MTREVFLQSMKDLEQDVASLADLVVFAIRRAVDALKNQNLTLADQVIADDGKIDRKRWEIEDKGIHLIARQQPVASDLREIIAVLNIITELERIADYAAGIAQIVKILGAEPYVKSLVVIPPMSEKAVDMLQRSILAFFNRDEAAAKAICNEDDVVDKFYEQGYHDLLNCMISDPKTIARATPLIWATHNIERIADRVTNICERTVFLISGSMQSVNVSVY